MNIKLAIFDLAGTTIAHNSEVHNSLIRAFQTAGIVISFEQANAAMGIAKPTAIKQLLEDQKQQSTAEAIKAIHENFLQEIKDYYRSNEQVRERSGTSKLFEWLKQKDIKIGIDTGFDRETADAVLARMSWVENGYVDFSVCSDEVERGRPAPDMVLKTMMALRISDPKVVMKVGDTPVDLLEGTNAKCRLVVGVLNSTHTRRQLQKYPHTHLVEELTDIIHLLEPNSIRNQKTSLL